MQTLGVSEPTAQSDSRLKNIFWPTIHTGTDVDTLGTQGFWICVIVGVVTFAETLYSGNWIAGFLLLIYFYLGGVGVRQHSCYAAVVVFLMYLANAVASPGIVNFFGCVLLISVMRATFIASFWEPETVEKEMPTRFDDTWSDKFADKVPLWLWPKIRYVYYIFSAGFLVLAIAGIMVLMMRRHGLRF
jgi:hypothetical protein